MEPESAAEFFHVRFSSLSLAAVVDFFISQSTVVNSVAMTPMSPSSEGRPSLPSITAMEKSLLLALALKWRQQSDNLNTDQIQELERDIWLSHIHSAMEGLENAVSLIAQQHYSANIHGT